MDSALLNNMAPLSIQSIQRCFADLTRSKFSPRLEHGALRNFEVSTDAVPTRNKLTFKPLGFAQVVRSFVSRSVR